MGVEKSMNEGKNNNNNYNNNNNNNNNKITEAINTQ